MYTLILIALFASAYCGKHVPYIPPLPSSAMQDLDSDVPIPPPTTKTTKTIATKTTAIERSGEALLCPVGWFHYDNSCFWYSRYDNRKAYAAARTACSEMKSNLFVSDSKEEFEAVMQHATRSQWTWIGLTGDSIHPSDANYFKWETNGGESLSSLPWLNTIVPAHGHTGSANCASYYAAFTEDSSYLHWYPCDMPRYYICERNGTSPGTPTPRP